MRLNVPSVRKEPGKYLGKLKSYSKLVDFANSAESRYRTWHLIFNFLALVWFIVAIELILKWNFITDIYTVRSTSQTIPLLIGIGGLLSVLYNLFFFWAINSPVSRPFCDMLLPQLLIMLLRISSTRPSTVRACVMDTGFDSLQISHNDATVYLTNFHHIKATGDLYPLQAND